MKKRQPENRWFDTDTKDFLLTMLAIGLIIFLLLLSYGGLLK